MVRQIRWTLGIGILAIALGFGGGSPAYAQNDAGGRVIAITQVDTSHFPQIIVFVSVTDAQGKPITNVPDSAFSLSENGQPVTITEVHQAGEQGPVSTVLTIDRSGSMKTSGKLEAARAAANAFVDLMRPEDKTALVLFNTKVEVAQPLTNDKNALHSAINAFQVFNDTAMYDAVQSSLDLLKAEQGRKVIVVLSDGLDNRSAQTADSVVGGLEQAETSVYTIGLGDPAIGVSGMAGINEDALRAMAEKSRGAYTYAPDPSQLQGLYQQISTRVQNEYRLTYTSPGTLRDGVRRGLEVHVAATAAQTAYNPGGLIPETALSLDWPIFGAIALGLIALLALPDVIRGAGGMGKAGMLKGGLFKKKSRVHITSGAAQKPAPSKGPTAPSRVRVHEKRS